MLFFYRIFNYFFISYIIVSYLILLNLNRINIFLIYYLKKKYSQRAREISKRNSFQRNFKDKIRSVQGSLRIDQYRQPDLNCFNWNKNRWLGFLLQSLSKQCLMFCSMKESSVPLALFQINVPWRFLCIFPANSISSNFQVFPSYASFYLPIFFN